MVRGFILADFVNFTTKRASAQSNAPTSKISSMVVGLVGHPLFGNLHLVAVELFKAICLAMAEQARIVGFYTRAGANIPRDSAMMMDIFQYFSQQMRNSHQYVIRPLEKFNEEMLNFVIMSIQEGCPLDVLYEITSIPVAPPISGWTAPIAVGNLDHNDTQICKYFNDGRHCRNGNCRKSHVCDVVMYHGTNGHPVVCGLKHTRSEHTDVWSDRPRLWPQQVTNHWSAEMGATVGFLSIEGPVDVEGEHPHAALGCSVLRDNRFANQFYYLDILGYGGCVFIAQAYAVGCARGILPQVLELAQNTFVDPTLGQAPELQDWALGRIRLIRDKLADRAWVVEQLDYLLSHKHIFPTFHADLTAVSGTRSALELFRSERNGHWSALPDHQQGFSDSVTYIVPSVWIEVELRVDEAPDTRAVYHTAVGVSVQDATMPPFCVLSTQIVRKSGIYGNRRSGHCAILIKSG